MGGTKDRRRNRTHTRTTRQVLMSTYNLTSTILGAGILSLPFAFRESGIIYGVLMLILTAILSNFSCGLVLSAYVWTHKASYGDLAGKIFGKSTQIAVETVVMLLNVGACAAYILVIKELMPPALAQLLPSAFESFDPSLLTAILVFGVVLPLCCLRDISSLRFTSMLAFGFAVFLVIAVAVRSIQDMVSREKVICDVAYESDGILGIFRALPLFSFSYICHLNVLPVYEFLKSRSPARMRRVFGLAMVFVTVLYVVTGTFGSLRFCEASPGNILGFPGQGDASCGHFEADDALITVARLAQTLTCTLALPLIVLPTRYALHSLIWDHFMVAIRSVCTKKRTQRNRAESVDGNAYRRMPRISTDRMADLTRLERESSSHGGLVVLSQDEDEDEVGSPSVIQSPPTERRTPMKQPLLSLEDPEDNEDGAVQDDDDKTCSFLKGPFMSQLLESLAIIGTSFAIAMTVPGVNVAFGLIGATLCTIVCYILPAMFYLGATSSHASDAKFGTRLYIRRALSRLLIVYGVCTGILGTSITVWESFVKDESSDCT